MSFRKEKKYRLSHSDMTKLKRLLFSKGMRKLYPRRVVTSCYFDTKNLQLFNDSEEGVLPRKKIRLRWYDNASDCNKEEKISSIEGRFKVTRPFNLKKSPKEHMLFDLYYGELKAVLKVKYRREYYFLGEIRITIDTHIEYCDIRKSGESICKETETVLEVKAPMSCGDNYIEQLIGHSTSRFSKYARGIYLSNMMN